MKTPDVDAAHRIDSMFDACYDTLRRIAGRSFRNERGAITLQPTAVVHEAYLRLTQRADTPWPDRVTFLAYAARVMRQILVDEARRRGARKRGGGGGRVTLDGAMLADAPRQPDVLDLDAALCRLERLDPRKAMIVQLRYFAGLGIEEVAAFLSLSVATVNRQWRSARAWLARELRR